jgi:hypothetical protein
VAKLKNFMFDIGHNALFGAPDLSQVLICAAHSSGLQCPNRISIDAVRTLMERLAITLEQAGEALAAPLSAIYVILDLLERLRIVNRVAEPASNHFLTA